MKKTKTILIGISLAFLMLLTPIGTTFTTSLATNTNNNQIENTTDKNIGDNTPPNPPEITGPTNGQIWKVYNYKFTITDPDGDEMNRLEIHFGDNIAATILLINGKSGTTINVTHRWTKKGEHTIKARVRDIHGALSDWGKLKVTMPKNKEEQTKNDKQQNNEKIFDLLEDFFKPKRKQKNLFNNFFAPIKTNGKTINKIFSNLQKNNFIAQQNRVNQFFQ